MPSPNPGIETSRKPPSPAHDGPAADALVKEANRKGEHLLAIEIAGDFLAAATGPPSVFLLQQQALALARSGSTQRALAVLTQLREMDSGDAETVGLLGRVHKDLAAASSDAAERKRFLAEAQRLYQSGFERQDVHGRRNTYCGINAAAVAVMIGDLDLARQLATEVLAEPGEADPYYNAATRAEAALILGVEEDAARLYRLACESARNSWANIASTRKQCRALALKIFGRQEKFDACFPPGGVAVFAGHLTDAPDRPTPRFPMDAEESVQRRIVDWLAAHAIRWTFSSAACGADLIFLAAARRAGVETHIVLPFAKEEFIRRSVLPGGERWLPLFEEALSHAEPITILNNEVADDPSGVFDFTNRMVAARAALHAATVDVPLRGLAVWDRSQAGSGRGGTADAAACWCRAMIPVQSIHPTQPSLDADIKDEQAITVTPFARTKTSLPTGCRAAVCSVLHLYFANYFDLRDSQYHRFQQTVLAAVANTLATTAHRPVSRYGLGPDYVFVFEAMRPAGLFAKQAIEALEKDIFSSGEPLLRMPRICLHAGPVQRMVNPVLNQYTHEGVTLTRAGRIVRRLEPGTAFCTDDFAALAALESIREFSFEYVGITRYGEDDTPDRLFSIRYR